MRGRASVRPHFIKAYAYASFCELIGGFRTRKTRPYDFDFQPQSFRRQNVLPLNPKSTGAPQLGHSPSFGVELVVNVHSG